MLSTNELYNQSKIPLDENLLNKLVDKYLNISFDDMSNVIRDLNQLLYWQINDVKKSNISFDEKSRENFLKQINEDFIKASRPYDPTRHNNVKNPISIMPGWEIYQSWNLLGTPKMQNISHRFYIAIENDKIYELMQILYDKFKKAGIPFYFKSDSNNLYMRKDNLVIYTTTPLLNETMKILQDLQKERSDLFNHVSEPSLIAGKISDKIGYASEQHNIANISYTKLITNTFLSTLTSSIAIYKNNNSNSPLRNMYNQTLQTYLNKGYKLNERMKTRILFNILWQNDINFRKLFFNNFQNELIKNGIDKDNICFDKKVKDEIENYYQKENISEKLQEMIPNDAKVYLKNGQIISGREFVNLANREINNFSSAQNLIDKYCIKIDLPLKENSYIDKINLEYLESMGITANQVNRLKELVQMAIKEKLYTNTSNFQYDLKHIERVMLYAQLITNKMKNKGIQIDEDKLLLASLFSDTKINLNDLKANLQKEYDSKTIEQIFLIINAEELGNNFKNTLLDYKDMEEIKVLSNILKDASYLDCNRFNYPPPLGNCDINNLITSEAKEIMPFSDNILQEYQKAQIKEKEREKGETILNNYEKLNEWLLNYTNGKQDYIYHASLTPAIEELQPNVSTQAGKYVYADTDPIKCSMMASFRLSLLVDRKGSKHELTELFPNVIDASLKNKFITLYRLPKEDFKPYKEAVTSAPSGEWISENKIKPIEEITIPALEFFNYLKYNNLIKMDYDYSYDKQLKAIMFTYGVLKIMII